ncbi:hypothetical protein SLA2020_046460 [Shorea laevis]
MVRFPCFNAYSHHYKSKKTVQSAVEAMHKTSEEASEVKVKRGSPKVAALSFLPEKRDALIHLSASATPLTSTALEGMKGM